MGGLGWQDLGMELFWDFAILVWLCALIWVVIVVLAVAIKSIRDRQNDGATPPDQD
jgi:heme/copper-type cytochrome/quinol oxidase subunit 2